MGVAWLVLAAVLLVAGVVLLVVDQRRRAARRDRQLLNPFASRDLRRVPEPAPRPTRHRLDE